MKVLSINKVLSENSITTSIGIIQGSSLSAILFLIYINDIKIQSAERIFLYADDCAANFSLQSENENVIANISKEIDEWYMRNKLALNKNKSELMVFTPKFKEVDNRIRNALSNGENLINNNILKSDVRYLGIFLDNKLNFELSCKKTAQLCAIGSSSIIKVKKCFPTDTKLNLYYAFVHSHLNFFSYYFPSIKRKAKQGLCKIQKRAIRAVVNAPHNSHTAEIYKKLNILPIEKLVEFNVFKFMYHLEANTELKKNFPYWQKKGNINNETTIQLRNDHHYNIPNVKPYIMKKNLPITYFPMIYNKYIDIFTPNIGYGDQWVKLREFMIEDYYVKHRCKEKNCYICSLNYSVKPNFIRDNKSEKTKNLIYRRGSIKKKKYNRLRLRYEKYFILNK